MRYRTLQRIALAGIPAEPLKGAAPSQPETNLYPMRGKVIRYDDPTEQAY